MPNKKSAEKELRKNVKRQADNKKVKKVMKQAIKTSNKAIAAGEKLSAENLSLASKLIDKAAKKGVIKKNTAARHKSRLAKRANKVTK
ncbi:MAG: 30S ribosomal protein S20 [Candidatus Parcubacteria bacterium]|jgi:small subunit ribosomal protein S20|nr:MAG: 30S ribosomal protein S20 [Candidatus Parcubacteria bacterium]